MDKREKILLHVDALERWTKFNNFFLNNLIIKPI
jgi:hypothetical protein